MQVMIFQPFSGSNDVFSNLMQVKNRRKYYNNDWIANKIITLNIMVARGKEL
jgi:hypothetical protein